MIFFKTNINRSAPIRANDINATPNIWEARKKATAPLKQIITGTKNNIQISPKPATPRLPFMLIYLPVNKRDWSIFICSGSLKKSQKRPFQASIFSAQKCSKKCMTLCHTNMYDTMYDTHKKTLRGGFFIKNELI